MIFQRRQSQKSKILMTDMQEFEEAHLNTVEMGKIPLNAVIGVFSILSIKFQFPKVLT